MFSHGALECGEEFVEAENVGLVIQPPGVSGHETVVVLIHGLIHPVWVSDVDVDGKAEVGAFLKHRIQSGIVNVHSPCWRVAIIKSFAFVAEFAHTLSSDFSAALEFRDSRRGIARFIVTAREKSAPNRKTARVFLTRGYNEPGYA